MEGSFTDVQTDDESRDGSAEAACDPEDKDGLNTQVLSQEVDPTMDPTDRHRNRGSLDHWAAGDGRSADDSECTAFHWRVGNRR